MPRLPKPIPDIADDADVVVTTRIPRRIYARLIEQASHRNRSTIGAELAALILEAETIRSLLGSGAVNHALTRSKTIAKAFSLSEELKDPIPFADTLAAFTAEIWAGGPAPRDPAAKDILATFLVQKLDLDDPPRALRDASIRGQQALDAQEGKS